MAHASYVGSARHGAHPQQLAWFCAAVDTPVTLIAASFAAGAVSAAELGNVNEHPDAAAGPTAAARTITLDASSVYSAKELQRAVLNAIDKVTVTDVSLTKEDREYERVEARLSAGAKICADGQFGIGGNSREYRLKSLNL